MCGICGFFHKKELQEKVLYNMNQTICNRGPDDEGYYLNKTQKDFQIGLAQKRLSVIDLSPLGHQPMFNNDKNIIVVFNGEIYNFQDIRSALIERGYIFKSNTDTEVILYAFKEWGIDCIHQFNGMFALALFDKMKDELYLIRDRMGVKPLYYYYNGQDIVFASELKPIMAYPYFQKEINFHALNMYLHHQYITAPHTIFKNTFKLNPGCYLTYKNGEIRVIEYWSVENKFIHRKIEDNKTEKEYIDDLEKLLTDSVRLRMISDVPLGGLLSGGIDSSLVAALMKKNSSKTVKTFTIGFDEDKYNEANYAKEVSKYLGTDHYEEYLSVSRVKELIEQIPIYYDEPFADSSQLPTMLVSEMVKKHATVSLSGDGGDELFCGYGRYDAAIRLQKYKGIAKGLFIVNKIIPLKSLWMKSNCNRKFIKLFYLYNDQSIINADYLYTKDYMKDITYSPYELENKYFDILHLSTNIQEKFMLQDMVTYLPDDILTKVDRASMRVSLEARTPLLDYRVVEYALSLPHDLKYRNGIKKYILKEILYKHVPKEIVDRPKMGFGVPIYKWLHEDLSSYIKQFFDKNYIKKQGIFNYNIISKLIKQFNKNSDASFNKKMWTLFIFQMWYDQYIK